MDVGDVDDDDDDGDGDGDKRRVASEQSRVTAERDLCSKSYALMHKLCPRSIKSILWMHPWETYL